MTDPNLKQPTRGADIMEGAGRARNNRDYADAANKLKNSYNPKATREMDSAAYEFLDHHVFSYVKDGKGKNTDAIQIIYFAGEHVSNIDLALIRECENDTELQDKGNKSLESAGYMTKAEEPDTDAQVLS